MGIPKCFSFLGCLEVTLVLRDYKQLLVESWEMSTTSAKKLGGS